MKNSKNKLRQEAISTLGIFDKNIITTKTDKDRRSIYVKFFY